MVWWLTAKKKVLFVKENVLKFESKPRRNPLILILVAWIWRQKDLKHTAEIVDAR
jgi:hypothetical protein